MPQPTGGRRSHGNSGMDLSQKPSGLHCRGVNSINDRRSNIAEAESNANAKAFDRFMPQPTDQISQQKPPSPLHFRPICNTFALPISSRALPPAATTGPDGGIGRRVGLKHQCPKGCAGSTHQCPKGCAGSTPAPGTTKRGNCLIFKQLPLLLFFKCSQIVPRESLHKIPNLIHHPILDIVKLPEMRFRTLDFLLLFNTQFVNID